MPLKAYAKANELTNGANPNVLISYGEAQGFAAGDHKVSMKESSMAVCKSLANSSKAMNVALWYAGIAAYQLTKLYGSSVDYLGKTIRNKFQMINKM